jgi:hypothetical protein
MEYLVIVTAALLLIGSISIAMPSKSSRKISKLRIDAKMLGCKISSNLYGKNKFKNKNSFDVSYQIKNLTTLKEGHFIRDKNKFILYSPVKLKYLDHFNDIERCFKACLKAQMKLFLAISRSLFYGKSQMELKSLKRY